MLTPYSPICLGGGGGEFIYLYLFKYTGVQYNVHITHISFNSNRNDVICETQTAYPSGARVHLLLVGFVDKSLVFCVVHHFLSFFFKPF